MSAHIWPSITDFIEKFLNFCFLLKESRQVKNSEAISGYNCHKEKPDGRIGPWTERDCPNLPKEVSDRKDRERQLEIP
jgi:hypothetical protein